MFERLIEKIILSYFGDFIENLDRNKLSVGILSGSVVLEDVVIKAKAINDLKLPFRLKYGRIGKLELKIPWKNNFSVPTVINIENIQIVLSLISQDEWEFLDFISADYRIAQLKKFLETRMSELSDVFVKEEKSAGFFDKAIIKVVDNLHINFNNMHIRIEDLTKKPFYSMGFTLDEMLIVNTNENWQEMFIDRNKNKDMNVFKLLKIQHFGFYLKTDETQVLSLINSSVEVKKVMEKLLPIGSKSIANMDYLIKPISLVAKMKQNNKNLEEIKCAMSGEYNTTQNKTAITSFSKDNLAIEEAYPSKYSSTSPSAFLSDLAKLEDYSTDSENSLPKMQLWINLENFDIDFQKSQFDTIIRILNHTSKYQKFQYFHYQSRKYQFYRPEIQIRTNPTKWWKYAIRTVIKRLKFLQGNPEEFAINPLLIKYYRSKFQEIYRIYLNNPTSVPNEDWKLFKRIIKLTETNILNEWAIDIIQEYFITNKKEEKQKLQQGMFSKMFGKKINEDDLLSKEEKEKIEEIIELAKKEIKSELIHTGKEIKFQIEFKLSQGSFLFSNYSNDKKTIESFVFKYKDLNFMMKSTESYSDIEAYLMDFQIDMLTKYNKENSKVTHITSKDKNDIINNEGNYVWKLNLRQNGPEEKINSKLDLHINTLNLTYHQNFLERVISFFVVETRIDEDLKTRAWDKWSELKEKTSEKIKIALEKKNILEIKIEPRKVIIPLNKYDQKRSRMLVLELGKVTMSNTEGIENYDERYILDFQSLSILHFNSLNEMHLNTNRKELVTDVRLSLIMGLLNSNRKDTITNTQLSSFKISLQIDSININLTETLYYTLHFIIDVMKPTKQQDYWAVIEQSKNEIKKNSKVFCKLNKRNTYSNYYEDYFAVISGGYIYFYKHADDDEFVSCYYIKDSKINECTSHVDGSYPLELKNKYGSLQLEFNTETKYKQWVKILKERVNEMKENFDVEEEVKKNENNLKISQNNSTSVVNVNENVYSGDNTNSSTILAPQTDINYNKISFGLELKINKVTANLFDENKICKETSSMEKLFTINFSDFTFILIMREKDIELILSLYSIRVFDEINKNHPNKESFYEILTSIDGNNSDCKLFYIKISIAEPASPRYRYNSIEIDLKIGYLYAVWQAYSIRRLMMYVAHNDILRNKIKEEILGVPIGINTEEKFDSSKKEKDNEDLNSNTVTNRILCTSSVPTELWIKVDITLQKVSIIWVNPITNIYFTELSLTESNLTFEMTYDHMVIKGVLGDTTLKDLTNYPYTIKSQNEYLILKKEVDEGNFKFTEILGFNNSSSLSFEYSSFSPFCPLLKNNYTTCTKVYFNSVRLTYIQEHFFRMFNYLFGEFLGSLAVPEEIKEYKNLINKIPVKSSHEFMDLYVAFNNPQVLIKPRPGSEEGFLADLGTVIITNSYQAVKGRVRKDPEEEKLLSIYHLELKNLFLISIKNNFKLIEDTNAKVDMKFINITEEEKNQPDDEIDKSFDINLYLNELVLNLRQNDFTGLMNCSDLNFLYQDGQNDDYNYDEYKKNYLNAVSNSDPCVEANNNIIEKDFSNSDENYYTNKIIVGNFMTFSLQIPSISLKLYENTTKSVFVEMVLFDKNMQFLKRLQGSSEIYIQIGKSQIFNYVNAFSKEIMLSYYKNTKDIEDKIILSKNYKDKNPLSGDSFIKNNTSSHQFDIKIVLDNDREKNIIVKIFNIKITLRLDTLQLLRAFFTEGLPYYEENAKDLPNMYDPDEDNYPGMRFYVEIKNPLIALLSETMTHHEQDVICLSTDFVFLYKKEKIIRARKELYDNHILLTKNLKNIQDESDKQLMEKDIGVDSKDIYLMGLWLYDVCPFMSNLSEIIRDDSENFESDSNYKRNIMNNFNMHYENKTVLQYSHPYNYIQSFRSNLDITQITMKLSYRDLVLFLKTIEYNASLMDAEYEEKIKNMTNSRRGAAPKNLINSESEMHPMQKVETPTKYSMSNDTRNKFNLNPTSSNKKESIISLDGENNKSSNNNITHLNDMTVSRASKSLIPDSKLDDLIINKGMGVMNIETGSLQIILIDDHANTYYPFLSIILQEIKFTNESMNFIQNILSGTLMAKIVTYNYYAGMWEPLMEKTSIVLEIINDISDESISYRAINFNVVEHRPKHGMILNISDLTITFLYPTLNSWIEKYMKLKSNYREEVKNMIKDETTLEKNMRITNHTVVNLTGRSLILHKVDVNNVKDKNLIFSKLGCVDQNETYDIEYFEEKEIESYDMIRRANSKTNFNTSSSRIKSTKHFMNNDISLNLVKDNYICFEFPGIDQSKISNNIIKIENIQLKSHKINYTDVMKKYKSILDLKPFEYITTEIKYHELRKFVYFYSPLVFKNKLRKNISLTLIRKEIDSARYILKPRKMIGIPFEYLDGSIEFSLEQSEDTTQINSKMELFKFDIRNFLNADKPFLKTEFKLGENIINLITNKESNKNNKHVTINICSSYILRNCLPFDIDIKIFNIIKKNFSSYFLKKSEKIYLENLSTNEDIICEIKFLNFSNKSKQPITLFSQKDFMTTNQYSSKKPQESSFSFYTSSFIVYDRFNNPLKLFTNLVESEESKVIVIYSNNVIINNSLMELKFYSVIKNKIIELPGQSQNTISTSPNVFLISDERNILIEVYDKKKGRAVSAFSEQLSINAIGLSRNFECRKKEKDFEYCYEFILETHLSLIAKDLEIYTNIISIHPRFVIYNNLTIPMLICLKHNDVLNNFSPEILNPGEKIPFQFFGTSSDTLMCFRPVENEGNIYQSGSKWTWSLPISLTNCSLMTIQINGMNPIEKKYLNIEKKVQGFTTFVILNESDYFNSQFVIENYSRNVSMKIYQEGFENNMEFVNTKSKCIYAWTDYTGSKTLSIEFMNGSIMKKAIIPSFNKEYMKKYTIFDDRIITAESEEKLYPICEVMKLRVNSYKGFIIKLEIFTDGMQKTIRVSDYSSFSANNENKTLNQPPNTVFKNLNSKTKNATQINLKINQLGVSIISDNRATKQRYKRNEIVYINLNEICFFNRIEIKEDETKTIEMQAKINSLQIDNEYAYITQYPIILRPVNINTDKEISNAHEVPFLNFTLTSFKNTNNPIETTKIVLLNYLIQSFVFSIDSEVMEAMINFISNITTALNTSLTQVNPLFESSEENIKKGKHIKEDFYEPEWLSEDIKTLTESMGKYFIQTMETSSIEIVLSFNAQTKSKVFEKYVTSNQILSSLLSTVSNLEKANIMLNGSKMNNLYGSLFDFLQLILSQYKQNILSQLFRIFGAIDVLGNPSNMISNLGTGVQDFFQKPIQGIIKGPLEGVKGAIDGSVSLVKHTVDGTFSATSKITGGLSKGILYLTQDDKYINELEKKKITERPKNFVEGLGYGITSMASGFYAGVSDVFVKPIEGAKKESVSGFGLGFLKGLGGLVAKPVSGMLELVSKTTEGIKNTMGSEDDMMIKPLRKPRAFYGKFKYIKSYNYFHSDVFDILNNKIPELAQKSINFYSAEIYKNMKDENVLIVFTTNEMFLIDLERREIKSYLCYEDIKDAEADIKQNFIMISFKKEMNGKSAAKIFFSKKNQTAGEIANKIKEAIASNTENFDFN